MTDQTHTLMKYHLAAVVMLAAVVLVAGCTFTGAPSPGYGINLSGHIRDASVIKLDANGSVEWQTPLSFGRDTIPSSVLPMPDGGYAITGQAIPGGDNYSPPRPFVAVLDANGSIAWNRSLPIMDISASGAAPLPDGGLLVTGSSGTFCRLDANGTVVWEKVLIGWTAIRTIVPDPAGGCLIGGSAGEDAAVARLNESGSVLWSAPVGRTEPVERILPLADGGLAVAGTAGDGQRFRTSVWVAHLDSDRTVLWHRTVEGGDSAVIWEISDLQERESEIRTVYEIVRAGYDGSLEAVAATFGQDGAVRDRRTLNAFAPVLLTPDGGYAFAAFPLGEEKWFYYGTVLHIVRMDHSGAVIRDSPVDLGRGSQNGPFAMTADGGYITAVTHGHAHGIAVPSGNGGTAAVGVAVRRE